MFIEGKAAIRFSRGNNTEESCIMEKIQLKTNLYICLKYLKWDYFLILAFKKNISETTEYLCEFELHVGTELGWLAIYFHEWTFQVFF